jgi:hypothetical protein
VQHAADLPNPSTQVIVPSRSWMCRAVIREDLTMWWQAYWPGSGSRWWLYSWLAFDAIFLCYLSSLISVSNIIRHVNPLLASITQQAYIRLVKQYDSTTRSPCSRIRHTQLIKLHNNTIQFGYGTYVSPSASPQAPISSHRVRSSPILIQSPSQV